MRPCPARLPIVAAYTVSGARVSKANADTRPLGSPKGEPSSAGADRTAASGVRPGQQAVAVMSQRSAWIATCCCAATGRAAAIEARITAATARTATAVNFVLIAPPRVRGQHSRQAWSPALRRGLGGAEAGCAAAGGSAVVVVVCGERHPDTTGTGRDRGQGQPTVEQRTRD